jgi:hypothetical protein
MRRFMTEMLALATPQRDAKPWKAVIMRWDCPVRMVEIPIFGFEHVARQRRIDSMPMDWGKKENVRGSRSSSAGGR